MSVNIFVYKLKKLAKDVYKINDIDKLNKNLNELNELYDKLIDDNNITNMEKEFILLKYIKFQEINMYIVPIINNLSKIIENKYNTYYCKDNYLSNILPLQ